MQPQEAGQKTGGWLERALIGWADRREQLASRLAVRLPRLRAPRSLRIAARLLGWTLTLRLPGEFGYWLRSRRLRGLRRWPARTSLYLPRSARPTVSVIIPSFGKVALTLRCLASIAASPPEVAMEVFVVDDASGDPALRRLRRVRGLRVLTTPRNLGFIGACNHAAGFARGEFLMFLNNDTSVRPGWLDHLVEALRAHPNAGAAGSKLLFPDGRLQEAGSIVWRDGTGCNYGRDDDPDRPEYNYLRATDYCSGAALLVRRALFDEAEGFDPVYAPAYYEDVDLAFRLRARGYATLYEPRSEVVHVEGASHGTDPARGIKSRQILNQDSFVARWRSVLSTEHQPRGMHPMRARDRAANRPVVLVVEHCVPEPDRDAGSQNVAAFLHALVEAGAAVKLWAEVIRPGRDYAAALRRAGIEVRAGGPAAFSAWMAENGADLDLVLLSRPEVAAAHLGLVRRHSGARVAFYGVDLHCARLRQQFALTREPRHAAEAARLERLERWLWRSVEIVLYPSQEEADAVRAMAPGTNARAVIPYCFTTFAERREPPEALAMLFVGGFAHVPNGDAAIWAATEILPAVQALVPGTRLILAGSAMPPEIFALEGPDVLLCPDLSAEDLRLLYAGARIVIVPLRFGAGVKLKVAEALREGAPLVTTTIGAQGLPGLAEIVPVADDPGAFAQAAAALLREDDRWREQAAAQVALARRLFDADAFARTITDALDLPSAPRLRGRPAEDALSTKGQRAAPKPSVHAHLRLALAPTSQMLA